MRKLNRLLKLVTGIYVIRKDICPLVVVLYKKENSYDNRIQMLVWITDGGYDYVIH